MIAVDTSVMVAGLASWHEHHDVAAEALNRRLTADDLVVPVPALIETYSVLTRLPPPYRVSPSHAATALRASFDTAKLAGFSTRTSWTFLDQMAERHISGGRTYDAIIVRAALSGGARSVLTFNVRHFMAFAEEIEIIDPRE